MLALVLRAQRLQRCGRGGRQRGRGVRQRGEQVGQQARAVLRAVGQLQQPGRQHVQECAPHLRARAPRLACAGAWCVRKGVVDQGLQTLPGGFPPAQPL